MADKARSPYFSHLADREEILIQDFLSRLASAAPQPNLVRQEDWRSVLDEMVGGLLACAESFEGKPAPDPVELQAFAQAAAVGERLAMIARRQGSTFSIFLQRFKLLRHLFLQLLTNTMAEDAALQNDQRLVQGFFDAVEVSLAAGWLEQTKVGLQRDLRQARYDLLHEKRRYFVVFQRMAEPAFVVDGNLELIDVNLAFEQFFGVDGKSQLGRSCCQLLGHDVCRACALEIALKNQTSFSNIEVNIVVNGQPRVVLLNGTFLGDLERGEPGILVALKDITEKKAIEQALSESEGKYRSLVENVPDAVWRADQSGRFFFISQNIEGICGYPPAEFMERGLAGSPYIHPDDAERVGLSLARLFDSQGRDPYDLRYRFLHRNGNWIWLYDRAGRLYEKDGVCYVDGVVSDVTRLKAVEEELEEHRCHLTELVEEKIVELRASNQRLVSEVAEREKAEEALTKLALQLKRSNQELEQFAHVASHDLKEPLLLIVAFCEKLMKRNYLDLDNRGRDYLDRIHLAARKMQGLIDDLLQLSRISRSEQAFESIDLYSLVNEVVGDLEEKVKEAQATIKIGELHNLIGDSQQMRQLLQNILANAIKFRKSNRNPTVRVQSRIIDNDICEITVEDNGIGFDEKYLCRIFSPFERLHSQTEYEGTGIGLATCANIAMRHGGEITARSTPGKGSVFIIRLPRYPIPAK